MAARGLRGARTSFVRTVTLLTVAGALGTLSGQAEAGAPAACPAAAADTAAARAAAATCQGRVEVLAQRTEEAQTFANPDGSFTLVETLLPRFARRSDGSWTTADATLRVDPDGTVRPTAPVFPMAFSGGGQRPLAVATRDGGRLDLTWPAPLPRPTVVGAVATYPDVPGPGVDLQIRAGVAGFSTVFVVKTRQAASHPALTSLTFGLSTAGLRTTTDPTSGAVRAVNPSGRVVFATASPLMWDSSSRPATAGVREPRMAASRIRIGPDSLTLIPDRALLSDPATEYPVYIDPTWTGYRQNWTLVRKTYPTSSYWNTTSSAGDDGVAGAVKVGFQDFESPVMTDRSLFQMNTTGVKGKVIDSAHFKLWQLWSSRACGDTGSPVYLWTTGSISSSTTWQQQPSWSTKLIATQAVRKYNQSGSCGPGETAFDVRQQVQNAADGNKSSIYLGLRADNENDNLSWRRYQLTGDHVPYLEVTYRSKPAVPDQRSSGGQACVTGASRPLAAAAPITLAARVVDADGGNVTATFQTADVNTDGTYTAWVSRGTSTKASNQTASVQWSGLTHGKAYAWRVMATDPSGLTSLWSGPCEFVASTVNPPVPTVTSPDGSYPEAPLTCAGGPGTTGRFQFTPNSTSVTSFRYRWNDGADTSVSVSAGESLTIKLTPPAPDPLLPTQGGPSHLHVTSLNSVGQPSDEYDYQTLLCDAAPATGRWTMSEGSGTTLADSAGPGPDLTFSAGTWSTAANQHIPGDPAISLAGSVAASTSAAGVDTATSFSVSAWVRPTTDNPNQFAVGQGTSSGGGFSLGTIQNSGGARVWAMTVFSVPTGTGSVPVSASGSTARPGVWTHLTGVFDAGGRVRLYVNGVLAGTSTSDPVSVASPQFRIGSGRGPLGSGYFVGDVDDVRTWPRAVSDVEIRGLAARLAGAWGFEEGPDIAYDTGPYLRDATWVNPWVGSTQVEGHSVDLGLPDGSSFALRLDGPTGLAQTSSVVVRTDQSLTVSAWARRTSTAVNQNTVVAQSGPGMSTLKLFWEGTLNKWRLTLAKADGSGWYSALASGTVTADTWYHLVGVYDAQAKELRLYIGVGAGPLVLQPKATGLGGTLASTNPLSMGNKFNGTIDDVVVFAGVLPDSVITNPVDPVWRIWS